MTSKNISSLTFPCHCSVQNYCEVKKLDQRESTTLTISQYQVLIILKRVIILFWYAFQFSIIVRTSYTACNVLTYTSYVRSTYIYKLFSVYKVKGICFSTDKNRNFFTLTINIRIHFILNPRIPFLVDPSIYYFFTKVY